MFEIATFKIRDDLRLFEFVHLFSAFIKCNTNIHTWMGLSRSELSLANSKLEYYLPNINLLNACAR